MTTKASVLLLDRIFTIDACGFSIDVRVLDVKTSYGQTRVQVEPVHGKGIHWIAVERLVELPTVTPKGGS